MHKSNSNQSNQSQTQYYSVTVSVWERDFGTNPPSLPVTESATARLLTPV